MRRIKKLGLAMVVLWTACVAIADAEENAKFSTPGPDKYEDGKQVLDGECYALVWTKDGEDFAGVTWDFKSADSSVSEIVKILAQASDGKCPETEITGGSHADGTYEVVLLDTRKPKEKDALTGLAAAASDALVSAWTIIDNTGKQAGWHSVKIAANGKSFSFNVLANVAEGYGVVSPDESIWTVYPLPTAYAKIVEPASIGSAEGYAMLVEPEKPIEEDPFSLEVTYQFDAFDATIAKVVAAITNDLPKDKWGCADFKNFDLVNQAASAAVIAGKITEEEATAAGEFLNRVYPFWDWNCDFEISFDADVKAGSFILAGKYAQAGAFGALYQGWVCSSHDADLAEGETMRLLADNGYKKDIYVTYYEICSRVQEFLCGAKNLSSNNWGKTITVKLNMYENSGRCNETDYKVTIGTYRYRFEGPLNIVFQAKNLPEGVVLPADIHTIGYTKAQPLPKPTNWPEGVMFTGWKTTSDEEFSEIPANYFSTAEKPLVLVATWENCQQVQVEEKTLDIKVDDAWVLENVGVDPTTEQIEAKLDETNEETGNANWIDYVINQSAAIEVTDVKSGDESTIPVVSNLQAPKSDTGFTVQYSLDKVESDEKTIVVEGELENTRDLSIDLSVEQPTGYYKMNVIVTPDDGGDSVKVSATNTMGVLKVETAQSPVIVSVPWTAIESITDITVAKVIKTSTLSEGDILHVYNTTTEPHFYYAWEVLNGAWSAINVWDEEQGKSVMSPDPTTWTIPRGIGMWLERADVSKPFYLSGLYNTAETATTQIEAGTPTEPAYNLIAPPFIEPTDLNDIESLNETTVDENDQIMVVGGTLPKTYAYEDGEWGYTKKIYKLVGGRMRATTVRVTDDSIIPAGTGAWYISGGGSPKIEWTQK